MTTTQGTFSRHVPMEIIKSPQENLGLYAMVWLLQEQETKIMEQQIVKNSYAKNTSSHGMKICSSSSMRMNAKKKKERNRILNDALRRDFSICLISRHPCIIPRGKENKYYRNADNKIIQIPPPSDVFSTSMEKPNLTTQSQHDDIFQALGKLFNTERMRDVYRDKLESRMFNNELSSKFLTCEGTINKDILSHKCSESDSFTLNDAPEFVAAVACLIYEQNISFYDKMTQNTYFFMCKTFNHSKHPTCVKFHRTGIVAIKTFFLREI